MRTDSWKGGALESGVYRLSLDSVFSILSQLAPPLPALLEVSDNITAQGLGDRLPLVGGLDP